MIFVTVGSCDPFDRLIEAVDNWVGEAKVTVPVLAQIAGGAYQPRHVQYVRFLSPEEYRENFSKARIVVSHAGMGTIITALELQKRIIVMPRLCELGELRNQHQLATVNHFQRSNNVLVAGSEVELAPLLNVTLENLSKQGDGQASESVRPADPNLIRFVRDFIS